MSAAVPPSRATPLADRRFLGLFAAQFLGAAHDNLLKAAVVVLVSFDDDPAAGAALATLAAGLLMLPFLLFSPLAGELADRYGKPRLVRLTKAGEMVLALFALVLLPAREAAALLALVFLMGTQSTFFGPLKYGLPPAWYAGDRLVLANGLLQGSTFVAILLGTFAGGVLVATAGPRVVAGSGLVVAILGFLASLLLPEEPPAAPDAPLHANPLPAHRALFAWLAGEPVLARTVLALSGFWALGAVYLGQVPAHARTAVGASAEEAGWLLGAFVVGIVLGGLAAVPLRRGRLGPRLPVLAMVLVGLAGLDLALLPGAVRDPARPLFEDPAGWRLALDVTAVAFGGGLFAVPLLTTLQRTAPATHRGRAIAANNVVNALAVVVASGLAAAAPLAGVPVAGVLLVCALSALLLALWVGRRRLPVAGD